ncbi:MAG: Rieske (2Fe-2S) protein [Burkholderiaceae bacterium]|nr:MAG: Rieske (2Fe-2S) protein [Burkholderiaceae bacterium]
MNTAPPRFICFGDQLLEGGAGVRFDVIGPLGQGTAFVVRYKGSVLGYLNQCRHVPAELDWVPGQFFDDSGLYLVCATHGALYEPRSGVCLSGPCKGKGLFPIVVEEREGKVYWIPSERIYPAG